MVRDPSSAGLLTLVLVPTLLSFMCAVFRAWVMLAVERERQLTMRLAIGWLAGAREPGLPPRGACRPRRSDADSDEVGDGQ